MPLEYHTIMGFKVKRWSESWNDGGFWDGRGERDREQL